jgi:hypothetical protein
VVQILRSLRLLLLKIDLFISVLPARHSCLVK